jgi:hypothetical protein
MQYLRFLVLDYLPIKREKFVGDVSTASLSSNSYAQFLIHLWLLKTLIIVGTPHLIVTLRFLITYFSSRCHACNRDLWVNEELRKNNRSGQS